MRNKKVLRINAAFKTNYPNAFIVEQLTPLRSKVAYMLRNDENVEKTWTINGKIKVIFPLTGKPYMLLKTKKKHIARG